MATENALAQLRTVVHPEGWSTEETQRAAMAHDASHYLLRPQAVVTPRNLPELTAALVRANRLRMPVTFRAGGTSLSGQGVSDSVLIDTRRHFSQVEVLDDGARVRCAPGAVLRRVNAALAPYRRRLGPDPASEGACTIGGVVANNSSGMTSGSSATAYYTMDSVQFVLPSGTTIDTAQPDADTYLAQQEPDLHAGLVRLRDQIRGDGRLRAIITHQYSMKNTMGYALNAFLDHNSPVQILAHLLVGSEGTLAYVASVVLNTVSALPHTATSLLVFDTIDQATGALPGILGAGAKAAELMDAAALRVAQRLPTAPAFMRDIDVRDHTAVLVELQAGEAEELAQQRAGAEQVLAGLNLALPAQFSSVAAERNAMWAVRKGLYPAVAGARPSGTTNLLEDVAVPPEVLTETVRSLAGLFRRYQYEDAVIFGHARDANLHFMINPQLDRRAEVDTYAAFTEDLVELILGANGTLKAEHGTGRVMSAYVGRQFGPELYEVMRTVKQLCDPHGVLAPGVVIDDDPQAHLKNLKTMPVVDEAVDRCMECGFCEPVCPSRNVTTTPRQRIVLMREIATADPARRAELERDFGYEAVQTCAADSMCVTACPVAIDTGAVMKKTRAQSNPVVAQKIGRAAADHWAGATDVVRAGLGVASALPPAWADGASKAARTLLPHDLVPATGRDLPGPGRRRSMLAPGRSVPPEQADVVLFPSCTGAMFGAHGTGAGAAEAFVALCERAGHKIHLPERIDELCCGVPWTSKGLSGGAAAMSTRVDAVLQAATDSGRVPVVTDAASCTHGLAESSGQVMDALTYIHQRVLPELDIDAGRLVDSVVVHPTCATTHLGVTDDLVALAKAIAKETVVPVNWGCCGFAGDRGLLHPELTEGATELEADEVARIERERGPFAAYVSANRTCEMGMSRATSRPYRHVLEVLEEVTRPA